MIKYYIRGENIEVTDSLRAYVEDKTAKLEKYFNQDRELTVRVNLKVYREKSSKVELTVFVDSSITLRAEDVSQDMYGSIDLVVDKLERQIRRNKTKIAKRTRAKLPANQVFTPEFEQEQTDEVPSAKVVRTKIVDLEPMTLDEALLQMELLGHDFFIYSDVETAKAHVIYKREDGEVGLIEAK